MQKQSNYQLAMELDAIKKSTQTTSFAELVAENELYKQELLRLKQVIFEIEHSSKISHADAKAPEQPNSDDNRIKSSEAELNEQKQLYETWILNMTKSMQDIHQAKLESDTERESLKQEVLEL